MSELNVIFCIKFVFTTYPSRPDQSDPKFFASIWPDPSRSKRTLPDRPCSCPGSSSHIFAKILKSTWREDKRWLVWPSLDVRELVWAAGIVAPRHYKAKAWRHNWLCLAAKKSCKILNIPLPKVDPEAHASKQFGHSFGPVQFACLQSTSWSYDKGCPERWPCPILTKWAIKARITLPASKEKSQPPAYSTIKIISALHSTILKLITTQWICFKSQNSGKFMQSVKIKSKWIMQTLSRVKSKQKAS